MMHLNYNSNEICTTEMVPSFGGRYLNPNDISVPQGYQIDVFAEGLDTPVGMVFNDMGEMIIAESGLITGNPRICILRNGTKEVIVENLLSPLTGVNYLNRNIYASHKGKISLIELDGRLRHIITGLPSNGDYSNYRVTFGIDGKMYFGQGTATNSGVVGLDNQWAKDYPLFCDTPGEYILVHGQNFLTNNMNLAVQEPALTGAFSPYGIMNMPFEVKKGVVRASGSILRANIDGSGLELYAWGLRNPFQLKFDINNRLFASNNGFDVRGSRPIANSPDEIQFIQQGRWYGWPDYTGGEPVTDPRFRPEGGVQPEFLIANHPQQPPQPYAVFPPHSNISGFEFNYNPDFGPVGDIYIAEFGSLGPEEVGGRPYAGIGHRVTRLDNTTRNIVTFAINRSGFPAHITGEGGFGYPIDIAFGPDRAMYILDYGLTVRGEPSNFIPNTGVIWRVAKATSPSI